MNSIVALPLAGIPTSSALAGGAPVRKPTKEELYAYAEWLANERSVLMQNSETRRDSRRSAQQRAPSISRLTTGLGRTSRNHQRVA
jgi:hypothetical protein